MDIFIFKYVSIYIHISRVYLGASFWDFLSAFSSMEQDDEVNSCTLLHTHLVLQHKHLLRVLSPTHTL